MVFVCMCSTKNFAKKEGKVIIAKIKHSNYFLVFCLQTKNGEREKVRRGIFIDTNIDINHFMIIMMIHYDMSIVCFRGFCLFCYIIFE